MDVSSLTDEVLENLLRCKKVVWSKRPKEIQKARHRERNLDVASFDNLHQFTLITRQSTLNLESFSCGLLWHPTPTGRVMLTRYNGSDHAHNNPIEGDEFEAACHIHVATQRYIALGRKVEHYAERTSRYNTLEGALKCLMDDCRISWPALPADLDDRQAILDLK